ncbi:MAG: NADP-dependent oxidoreductase [Candidatus Manganitrophaceae bacterium]|nr:MAG: NADP-dependent oxidoreductase [Candidatus Manganitrophaceae bacterium]
MQAAAIDRFGPPSVLTLRTLPVPEPGPHEVMIALHAAGVGIWDARMRDGAWWPTDDPTFPIVLGTDGAGTVAAKGPRVRRFQIGDRVWAYEYANPKGGFYAEYVAVDADQVGRAPTQLDLLEAGASAVTGLTALQGIDDVLRVGPAKTVLIFGASGAVGSLAVQFAKRRKARVLGTASGRDAARLVRRLGADAVIDARSGDAVEQLRALAPDGIDALLALAGGDPLGRLLPLVRAGGWIAYPNGVEPEPKPRPSVRVRAYDAVAGPREFARLDQAVAEAKLRVPIAAVYPLEQAAQAHERIEKGHVLGRIALQIRGR